MLKTELTQKQMVTQQMVQSAAILQMSAQELELYLQDLALENPVVELEEAPPQEDLQQMELQRKIDWLEEADYQNRAYYQEDRTAAGSKEDAWHSSDAQEQSLSEYLRLQLLPGTYSRQDWRILEYLIESLDARGYFTDGIRTAAEVLHVSEEKVKAMLEVIQGLEPAGIGAADLRECLLLQLRGRQEDTWLAEKIVESYLGEMGKNHLKEIARTLHATREQVQEACRMIRSLHPKPGSVFYTGESPGYIRPDALVLKEHDSEATFRIIIREGISGTFRISEYYQALEKETDDPETRHYLKAKLSQAFSVARDIETRKITLYRVVGAIVNRQSGFFSGSENHKKPLRLSDLAEDLEVHESTVSRALKGKYLQCSRGVFPLRYFLTGVAVADRESDEGQTPEEVKEAIRKIVEAEDKRKPLNDGEIQARLAGQNIHIARRTVNKYRQELGITDKAGRRIW